MDGPAATRSNRLSRCFCLFILIAFGFISTASAVPHGAREQAKRMHDRIAGVPPSSADLATMAGHISDGNPILAAEIAAQHPAFYNITLKTHAAPWTNRDQSQFVPLNDYTATVIGLVRDNIDFREVLTGNVLYVGDDNSVSPYTGSNNDHYEELEIKAANLKDVLIPVQQSSITGVPATDNAGVLTTRAAAEAFFVAGTNRAMFRFTLMNHLCTDLEPIMDTTRIPDRIRQDISRSPGGDSRIFMNSCIGCHSGMDPLAGAFAYFNFNESTGRIEFTKDADFVQPKMNINSNNFPQGYFTVDDSWKNYWREGPNAWMGWNGPAAEGEGINSMANELANSEAFASCHVKQVFETVCLREPVNTDDREYISLTMLPAFQSQYNLREQFKLAGVYCMGEEE